jgi:hypothetical protein
MYIEYADQINEDNLYYDQVERTSDIQLPSVVNILLLGGWLVICLVGFAIIFFAKNIVLGITVIGIPTFLGMVMKPTFALCVLMLVLLWPAQSAISSHAVWRFCFTGTNQKRCFEICCRG